MAAAAAREKAAATGHHHHGSHHHHHLSGGGHRGALTSGGGASSGFDRQRHQVAPLKVQLNPSSSLHQHHHRHHGQRNSRNNMYESYQLWAMKTYGDSAKTKTVTRKKYNRIVKTLKGEEQTKAENSKFRFWVKAKGFRIGPPPNHHNEAKRSELGVLYVSCPTQAKMVSVEDEDEDGGVNSGSSGAVFKKVAVVENFFDIIYNVHVEMDGRGGKHAGQKKTYKAIAEMYAFLPREAVTKFLMQCADCQKRMHPGTSSSASFPISTAQSRSQQLPPATSTNTSKSVSNCEVGSPHHQTVPAAAVEGPSSGNNSGADGADAGSEDMRKDTAGTPPEINFSLPITTTYLKHLRSLGYSEEEVLNENSGEMNDDVMDHEDSISNDVPISNSDLGSPIPFDDQMSPNSCKEVSSPSSSLRPMEEDAVGVGYDDHPLDMTTAGDGPLTSPDWSHHSASPSASPKWTNTNSATCNSSPGGATNHQLPINMCRNGDVGNATHHSTSNNISASPPAFHHRYSLSSRHHSQRHSHRHHRRSYSDVKSSTYRPYPDTENMDDGAVSVNEGNSAVVKDEDEEDDDEADDEKTPQQCDPERLKAFNLFVRLFVDENLDRMVPISKQPKEKIQAIMDSCSRQFPEFSERSRKRIRTYLKSCRRTKRCRDQNGWDPARPTPPHLTSAMAEQILATACENESTNAKRMRLGLEPICASLPGERDNSKRIVEPVIQQPSNLRSYISDAHRNGLANGSSLSHRIHSNVISNRGASPSRFPAIKSEHKTPTAHFHKSTSLTNGPADLSTKRSHLPLSIHQTPSGSQTGQSKCPLNPSEVNAVRQLIAGYRESAAFLVRSADELEQLLLQQN